MNSKDLFIFFSEYIYSGIVGDIHYGEDTIGGYMRVGVSVPSSDYKLYSVYAEEEYAYPILAMTLYTTLFGVGMDSDMHSKVLEAIAAEAVVQRPFLYIFDVYKRMLQHTETIKDSALEFEGELDKWIPVFLADFEEAEPEKFALFMRRGAVQEVLKR